jgi:hypothetical protein
MLVEDWEAKNFNGYNIDRKFIDQAEQQSQLMTSLENRLTDAERKEAELQARIAELQAQLEGSKKVRNQKQTTDGNQ